ncbi:linearmycin resistance ATP-binding protein LnrL [soil metagenome]
MAVPFLHATELRKRFGHTVALDGVSLDVAKGELFGLLGPNGAGKTTLLSILAGLLDADAGQVQLAGHAFTRQDRELRRRVGIGTQDLAVYPELTARENLVFFGRLYDLGGPALTKRVDELLAAVGLSDRANDRAGTFSGGMKRRLNLAVAVVHNPDILFLDEPTTGVDPQSRNHIFELVKSLNAAGMTIIYTSHYMEEVQLLCPRLAIIDHGQVKACSTIGDLLKMLDASVRIDGIGPNLVADFKQIPSVKSVSANVNSVDLTAESIAPLLPAIAEVCRLRGVTPTALHVNEPTLERVFLHLTGNALRD